MGRPTQRSWIVACVVALGALVYTTGPLYRIRTWWGFSDPLAADRFVIVVQVLLGVAAAVALIRGQRWRRIDRRAGLVAAALVLWLVLGALWSASTSTTLRESLLIGVGLVAGAGAAAVTTERLLILSTWVGVHVGLAWSAVLIVLVRPGSQDANGEWTGVFFNPNSLALVAAFGMFLSIVAAIMVADRRGRIISYPVLAASMVADLWLISGTGALTPLFGLVVALAVGAAAVVAKRIVGPTGRHPLDARVVAGVSGLVLLTLGAIAWWSRGTWLSSVGRTSELTGRTAMWDVALDWFGQRPLLGQGYLGAWFDPTFAAEMLAARGEVLGSTHNSFIELLLGAGIVGFVLAVLLFSLLWVASGARALAVPGLVAVWPLAALVYVIVENLAETLLVGGQLTVVILGALMVVSSPAQAAPPTPTPTDVDADVVGVEQRS